MCCFVWEIVSPATDFSIGMPNKFFSAFQKKLVVCTDGNFTVFATVRGRSLGFLVKCDDKFGWFRFDRVGSRRGSALRGTIRFRRWIGFLDKELNLLNTGYIVHCVWHFEAKHVSALIGWVWVGVVHFPASDCPSHREKATLSAVCLHKKYFSVRW